MLLLGSYKFSLRARIFNRPLLQNLAVADCRPGFPTTTEERAIKKLAVVPPTNYLDPLLE